MTLQNGLVHGRHAYLWTDTAFWNGETGEPVGFASKAFQGLYWPFAGVVSAHGGDPQAIARAIGNDYPADVGELLASAARALSTYCLQGGCGRVLLATNLDGPRLFIIASDGAGLGDPFQAVELAHFASSGNQTHAYREAARLGFTPGRMRRVIDAQIDAPFDGIGALAKLPKKSWIGGNVVEFEVMPSGVDSRVLRPVSSTISAEYAA